MNEQQCSYYAFISHNSADEKWAKWLQYNLEYYHIPSALCKEYPGLPKKIRPIFWYKQDLSGTKLKKALNNELSSSKYLIVICSPNSAKADWVNDEVIAFIEQGKGDRIIPFIVAGTPHAKNPDEECFPPELRNLTRDEEIRGIDVRRKEGKFHALVDVIATMFGVRFDMLWQRHERRRKMIRNMYISIIFILLLIIGGIYDYYFNIKYKYYLDYADCNGKPTGIMSINKDQVKREYRTYRFEYLRNKLRRVVYVDCNGNVQPFNFTEYKDRFSIQELIYENGKYVGLECKSHLGDIICKYNYNKNFNSVNISDENDDLTTSIIGSISSITDGEELRSRSLFLDNILSLSSYAKIGRYEYDRDSSGYISVVYFCENPYRSQRTTDKDGIAGVKYLRDSLHRVISMQYIDILGNPKADKYGVVSKNYIYDTNGYLSVSEYYNEKGELQYNELGWAKAIVEYDENGYPHKQSLYGTDGNYCRSVSGEVITKYEWNSTYFKVLYFDEKESPILISGSSFMPGGYHSMIQKIDINGDVVQSECYDLNNDLCYNNFHWAIRKCSFDQRRPVEESYWSPKNEPCYNCYYFHCMKTKYQNGLIVSQSIFGSNGIKISGPMGFHSVSFDYDYKRISSIKTYNILGMLCPSQVLINASQVEIKYSDAYPSAIIFKDVNGKLCLDPYRDINNTMIPFRDWAICRIKTENGLKTEFSYYDDNEKKALCKGFFFKKKIIYDEFGREIKTFFYDQDDNLTQNEDGVYVTEIEYDAHHFKLPSSITFKTDKDKLCNNNFGVAKINKIYDSFGRMKMELYFNEDNEPTLFLGAHLYNYEYDNKNRLISISAMNKDGSPSIQMQNKCHKLEYVYDNFDRVVEMKRYDVFDRLINQPLSAVTHFTYGQDSQIVKCEYFDNNYKLCNNPDDGNIAIALAIYDELGRKVHEKFLDKNNKLILNKNKGYAEFMMKYKNNSKLLYAKDEFGLLTNTIEDVCCMVEIYSETFLPLFGGVYRINDKKKIEFVQRVVWEYAGDGTLISNYSQDYDGGIRIWTLGSSQVIYNFQDEYASISDKIDSIEYNMVKKVFDIGK